MKQYFSGFSKPGMVITALVVFLFGCASQGPPLVSRNVEDIHGDSAHSLKYFKKE